jgi:hypothetical protein
MSDPNVLELGCSRAYDRGENPLCGLDFPGIRGVGADLAAILGWASVFRVDDGPMWLLGPSS